MPLNPNHPFVGRRHSDISEDELQDITETEYQEYVQWGVENTLKYMLAEGLVETYDCPITGEVLYRLAPGVENTKTH
jgi:hypothetical protein